jgi:hypothetical protein
VARELIEKYEFSQIKAAEKLGTTQAAISQYLSSKRGMKQLKQLASLPSVKTAVNEVASEIASSEFAAVDAIEMFCKLCTALRKQDVICALHHDSTDLPKNCHVCLK